MDVSSWAFGEQQIFFLFYTFIIYALCSFDLFRFFSSLLASLWDCSSLTRSLVCSAYRIFMCCMRCACRLICNTGYISLNVNIKLSCVHSFHCFTTIHLVNGFFAWVWVGKYVSRCIWLVSVSACVYVRVLLFSSVLLMPVNWSVRVSEFAYELFRSSNYILVQLICSMLFDRYDDFQFNEPKLSVSSTRL